MSLDSPRVAYFCMEYGLDDALKTYSGGLGILAGDHLKGAHDLGLPLVGIGLKWKQGYVQQQIDEEGFQVDAFPTYFYGDDVMTDTGVEVAVTIAGDHVRVKVWKCDAYGNAPLYLLDTDLDGNPHRWTTGQLYAGPESRRVAQEIVLGVGGVRALRALGIETDVYHFNEGHALLAAFELAREKMERGMSRDEALAEVREECVFTTHTPIPQGNETHPTERLVYMGAGLGVIDQDKLREIGGEPFNMTVGALRLARVANGVAQLHGKTANDMWNWVEGRAPIHAITNGVHPGTWIDPDVDQAAVDGDLDGLWRAHQANKRALIAHTKERTGVQFTEDKLLIGFARRAVAYKRAMLIFEDEQKISPLLETGRVQLVFAGKAHPMDSSGKAIVQGLVEMQRRYPDSVAFITDYDMVTGAAMTRGSDVWLNTPRRPKEASGTSGMKAAMNGVLNASILDGWWPEAVNDGKNGWDIGSGFISADQRAQDEHDEASLYDVLLNKIIPTYYDERDTWIEMMRQSILDTRDFFSCHRMVREYVEMMYRQPVAA
ncbi:alpha-glucan family phosphorylase [Rubricoccus marinus]|uniref:glycogen phosphorylase n=1 Tax=Rubricoccus marinus TaxID=716817 RepID=A0A259U000_9BACT|nr:alpha-glucan family phosphorylase [Rubricoccus marinus]OZC03270.1 alpha-glucan phosphorylase [Rubricoccus marinus]